MAKSIKQRVKLIGRYIWELFKSSILPSIMYCCAGAIMLMVCIRGEKIEWEASKMVWAVVCLIGGAAYQGMAAFGSGGSAYEMLVSGNVKRATFDSYGNEYRMSNHKIAKEYRPWKGFVIGAMVSFLSVVLGIVFGCLQDKLHAETVSKGLSVLLLLSFFFCGWTIVPFYYLNEAGFAVSYFVSLTFSLIPVLVGGGMYIAGAYARRNKNARLRMLEDKTAAEEAARRANKKINYGGLPGTKPKKRK